MRSELCERCFFTVKENDEFDVGPTEHLKVGVCRDCFDAKCGCGEES